MMNRIGQSIKNILHRFRQDERGASAIELAMISTVLSLILLNIVDISYFMFKKMELTSSVRAGAQYALVDTENATAALIEAVVQDSSPLTNVTVTVDDSQCGCSDGGALFTCGSDTCTGTTTGRSQYYTQISAAYTHTWIFYPGTVSITADSTIRTQ